MYDKEARRRIYSEKLRDPRWQRKRLEIMQRDDFTCQYCCDTESTLNVHHNYYKNNADPWDYPSEALVTLCENCHQEESENRRHEEQLLLDVLRRVGCSSSHLNSLSMAFYYKFGEQSVFSDYSDYLITSGIERIDRLVNIIGDMVAQDSREAKARESKECRTES